MQKKIIALAVAGLVSGGAFAQSNVTIYGIVDVGFENSNSGYGTKTRVTSGQSAGSRIGFRGEENLGGGTSAFFNLENGFLLDNGQTSSNGSFSQSSLAAPAGTAGTNVLQTNGGSYMFQRLAIAGLKGSWGTVQGGRMYTPAFAVRCASDNTACGTGAGLSSLSGTFTGYADRFDNAVAYVSPNMNGFSASVALSSGLENNTVASAANDAATGTNRKAGQAQGFNLQYANGPAYVGLAYHQGWGTAATAAAVTAALTTGTATDVTRAKGWLLGGTYDFKAVKLHMNYASGKGDSAGLANNRINDNRVWAIGVTVPVGAHSFRATYGQFNDKTARDADWKQTGLSYEYAMSKRTALYGAWSKVKNEDRVNLAGAANGAGTVVNAAVNTGMSTIDGNYDPRAIQFGMRHSF